MDLKAQREIRRSVESRRQAPREPAEVLAAYDGGGIGGYVAAGPILLTIEATNGDSELASWLDDLWWTDVIQRWAEYAVTVAVAPTPGALLNPVVLHHVEMLRRVLPAWRIIGHAYRDDLAHDEEIIRVANSPYHEVRFFDQSRPRPSQSDQPARALALEELFGRIRREQLRMNLTRPALVRLPPGPPGLRAGSSPPAESSLDTQASPNGVR